MKLSRTHTLSDPLADQEEVVVVSSGNQGVYDGSRRRIFVVVSGLFRIDPRVDPFLDDHEQKVGVEGFVDFVEGSHELRDFVAFDDVELSVADAVAENHHFLRIGVVDVVVLLDGINEGHFEGVYEFLARFLSVKVKH